ncbi:MAG: hypothetical protein GXP49_01410 [Deltaproteobacteria bacterium]|nr:hypothetical protein [Deltaproteobacteria bacterium]
MHAHGTNTGPIAVPRKELPALADRPDLRVLQVEVKPMEGVGNKGQVLLITFLGVDGAPHANRSGKRGKSVEPAATPAMQRHAGPRELGKEKQSGTLPALALLTPRQREIALLAAYGFSGPNIAAKLGLAEATVYSHLKRIHKKLGIHNRAQLTWLVLGRNQASNDHGRAPHLDLDN